MKEIGPENTTTVLVVESSALPESAPSTTKPFFTQGITLKQFADEQIELDLAVEEASWLRLGVSYDPGWSATLDGTPLEIHPAQLAFMAVKIPEGRHSLKLHYRPAYFRLGLVVTFGGLIFLGCGVLLVRNVQNDHATDVLTPDWFAPKTLAILLVILLVVSTLAYHPGNGIGVSSRWNSSWHQFTWGAGLEAMR
jgi:hypothetical protein